jgi:hypothetical protein
MIQKIIIPLSNNREIQIAMHYDPNKQTWYCEMDDETLLDIITMLDNENQSCE